jgi:hypothetical protein
MRHPAWFIMGLIGVVAFHSAAADPASDCAQVQGVYLKGTAASPPKFYPGKPLQGVELSHTRLSLSGTDGKTYQVAIDNVFAAGYNAANPERKVPSPLDQIKVGDQLEMCGVRYSQPAPGIDWVHTNCGDPPVSGKPDGWIREVAANGSTSDNMESSQEYCRLWPHGNH